VVGRRRGEGRGAGEATEEGATDHGEVGEDAAKRGGTTADGRAGQG
jgi:hypothetical protein